MIDIRLIRAEPDRVKTELAKVGVAASEIDALLECDRHRRELIQTMEQLRAERTTASKAVRDAKDPAERERLIAAQQGVGERIAAAEADAATADAALSARMLELPNLPHPDVPVGPDDSANIVVRSEGTLATFPFTPIPHWDLGPRLGLLDFERGVKISGSRFYVLKGEGARLQRVYHVLRHGVMGQGLPRRYDGQVLGLAGDADKNEFFVFRKLLQALGFQDVLHRHLWS